MRKTACELKPDAYRVTHPEYGTVDLVALTDENAVLLACREWHISWGLNACDCRAVKLKKAERGVCRCCGYEAFVNGNGLCNQCAREKEIEKRAYFRQYPVKRERP
ncbi:MAG: hypothetical protein LKK00_01725 [Intestinimonas sp.]|nr:hypothetical protein [Intestinimonas sp.]